MKNSVRQALRRLRKVQEDIFYGKLAGIGASLEISVIAKDFISTVQNYPYFSVYAQKRSVRSNDRDVEHIFLYDNMTQDDINAGLDKIGKFLNYNV